MLEWVMTLIIIIVLPLIVASSASKSITDININLFMLCLGATISILVWAGMLDVYYYLLPASLYTFMLFRNVMNGGGVNE